MKIVKLAALTLLLTTFTLEGVLRLTDPFGLNRSLTDLSHLQTMIDTLPTGGYTLHPGAYDMDGWRLTLGARGDRVTPDNHAAPCRIVLLGDSVTMGWGVDDAQAWPNLIAKALPGVQIVNTGVVGYNVQDVYEIFLRYPGADAYLYLLIENDDQPRLSFFGAQQTYPLLTLAYLNFIAWQHEPAGDAQFFTPYAARLNAVPNLQVAAFAGEPLARYFPHVQYIPPYTHRISRADPHADAVGNQEIAIALLPIVRALQSQYCAIMRTEVF